MEMDWCIRLNSYSWGLIYAILLENLEVLLNCTFTWCFYGMNESNWSDIGTRKKRKEDYGVKYVYLAFLW